MRIYAFHLLNDYSGSPKVLMQLVKGWKQNNIEVILATNKENQGFLSEIDGIIYKNFNYKFAKNPLIRLIRLLFSQVQIIFQFLFRINKQDIVYVNTVLPFGAGILGKLVGCRVIYHIHETSVKPKILKKFLFGIVRWTADEVIYVSEFLAKEECLNKVKKSILHNGIEDTFLNEARIQRTTLTSERKNVLMVCSLKEYKGVHEFISLANKNPEFSFKLVVNSSEAAVTTFKAQYSIPTNVILFPTHKNLHPFYQWADIILNLSRPDQWVETFGLTIIEGMAYGLPAIVPPVGGITELVEDGSNGFHVDCRNGDELHFKLNQLLSNKELYFRMKSDSLLRINQFSEISFISRSISLLYQADKPLEKPSKEWKNELSHSA